MNESRIGSIQTQRGVGQDDNFVRDMNRDNIDQLKQGSSNLAQMMENGNEATENMRDAAHDLVK